MKLILKSVIVFLCLSVATSAEFVTPDFVTLDHTSPKGSTSDSNIKCFITKSLEDDCVSLYVSVKKGFLKHGSFSIMKAKKTILSVPFTLTAFEGRDVWVIDIDRNLGDHYNIFFNREKGKPGLAINLNKLIVTPKEKDKK